MSNKIILSGLRDLATDETLDPQKDYGLFIVASRVSEERMDDEPDCFKYRLKMSHIDSILDLKEKKEIKYAKGKSPSQKLYFAIINNLGNDEYNNFMNYLLGRADELADDYRENFNPHPLTK